MSKIAPFIFSIFKDSKTLSKFLKLSLANKTFFRSFHFSFNLFKTSPSWSIPTSLPFSPISFSISSEWPPPLIVASRITSPLLGFKNSVDSFKSAGICISLINSQFSQFFRQRIGLAFHFCLIIVPMAFVPYFQFFIQARYHHFFFQSGELFQVIGNKDSAQGVYFHVNGSGKKDADEISV